MHSTLFLSVPTWGQCSHLATIAKERTSLRPAARLVSWFPTGFHPVPSLEPVTISVNMMGKEEVTLTSQSYPQLPRSQPGAVKGF